VIDGFRLEAHLHQGGMANLWRVTHPDHALPMVMKVPRIKGGEDPATIVGFEVEQMIMPRCAARMCRSSSQRATSPPAPTS
jgi:hypothetical protein